MTERPILFGAPMVRAILDGRKTQTRRVVRATTEDLHHPAVAHWQMDSEFRAVAIAHSEEVVTQYITTFPHYRIRCRYGQPGDRLWVRENGWQRPERTPKMMREGADTWERYYYDADGLSEGDHEQFKAWGFKRRPSIHMPRWASRITLEVTGVRVERLNEISEADARAEGVEQIAGSTHWKNYCRDWRAKVIDAGDAVTSFRTLWESINGPGSWGANPYVWVIEFRRAEGKQ